MKHCQRASTMDPACHLIVMCMLRDMVSDFFFLSSLQSPHHSLYGNQSARNGKTAKCVLNRLDGLFVYFSHLTRCDDWISMSLCMNNRITVKLKGCDELSWVHAQTAQHIHVRLTLRMRHKNTRLNACCAVMFAAVVFMSNLNNRRSLKIQMTHQSA